MCVGAGPVCVCVEGVGPGQYILDKRAREGLTEVTFE